MASTPNAICGHWRYADLVSCRRRDRNDIAQEFCYWLVWPVDGSKGTRSMTYLRNSYTQGYKISDAGRGCSSPVPTCRFLSFVKLIGFIAATRFPLLYSHIHSSHCHTLSCLAKHSSLGLCDSYLHPERSTRTSNAHKFKNGPSPPSPSPALSISPQASPSGCSILRRMAHQWSQAWRARTL